MPNTVILKEGNVSEACGMEGAVPGLALVATRPLEDEEVLLNYRLSIHVEPPPWYYPVDTEEDKRRWA